MDRQGGDGPGGTSAANAGKPVRPLWLRMLVRFMPLILLIAGGLLISLLGLAQYLSLSEIVKGHAALVDYVGARPFATVGVYFVAYILAVVFSVPGGSLLTIIGGVLFGGIVGGLIATVAATAGSVCVFLIARTAIGDWMRRRAQNMGPRVTSLVAGFQTNAFYVIVVLRLVPVIPYWASNALPAMFGVRIWIFIAATLVGLLPWTVSFAFFGAALDGLVAAQEVANPGCAEAGTCQLDFSALTSGPVITGILFALAALIPVGLHWWARRRKEAAGSAPRADV